MRICLVAAVAANNAIGINNKLPWYLPGDLRYFKQLTMGKPLIMGRKTFESLGKPLPGRTNIVITRNQGFAAAGAKVVHTLDEAIDLAESIGLIDGCEEMMVIGGAQIYQQALPLANRLYLTRVHRAFEGDTFFPEFDDNQWQLVDEQIQETDHQPPLKYSYQILNRV
ncbi:dihydrofolate reductase [Spartinivicinus ruber]|uniref:dihydrofolate reductase n=1 Tax=Spartinivicinus ruber TaxID=2683272 RepID=UPI0013D8345F|nr:dihydrofolate reductase [Spartinivicinus ruber]